MLFKEKVLDGYNKDALELWQTFMTSKFYEGLQIVLTDQDLEDVYFIEFSNQIFLFKIMNYQYYIVLYKKGNTLLTDALSNLINYNILANYFESKFCSPDVTSIEIELEFFESHVLELFTDCLFFDSQNNQFLRKFFNQFNTIKTHHSLFEDLIEKFINASDFKTACSTAKDLFYYGITLQQAVFKASDCKDIITNMPQSLTKLNLVSQVKNIIKSPYNEMISDVVCEIYYVNTIFM